MNKCFTLLLVAFILAMKVHGQWTPVDTTRSVTALRAFGDTLVIGTNDGQVRWSSDGGSSWSGIFIGLPNNYVDNVELGANGRLLCTAGSAVYRTDNWTNWTLARTLGYPATSMSTDGAFIIVGAELNGGITASNDNGTTWNFISGGLSNQYVTTVATDGIAIYAGFFGSDPAVSYNMGATWNPISGLSGTIFSLFHDQGLYAGSDGAIYCQGSPWTTYSTNTQILDFARGTDYLAACGTFAGTYISPDDCGTWFTIPTDHTTFQLNKVAFQGNVLFVGNSDGLWKLDLADWVGIQEPQASSVPVLSPNPANDLLSIDLPEPGRDPIDLEVTDLTGRVIRRTRVPAFTSRFTVAVQDLVPGRYAITLRGARSFSTRPFLVVR
jgi:hypothetical protein